VARPTAAVLYLATVVEDATPIKVTIELIEAD